MGKSIPLAGEALANEGLKLGEREEAPSETVPEGEVVRQSPEVGTEVEAGSPVSVTVSTGASTIEVPDLGSLNRSEASRALTAVGLKLGGYHEAPNETTPEGEITAQHPPAHTKARRGSSVSITVSTGPQKVTVPDLSKQTPPKAREMLAAAGLKFGPQDEAPSDAVSEGKIIKQYPVAGTKTERGSSVSVAISLGTSTVEVPDLAGLKHSEASSMLAAAGLKLGDQIEAPNDNVPEGRIVSQYPAAGTRVSPDSPISIMVSTSLESALVSDITGESAPVLPIRVPSRLSSFIGGFFALVCSSVLWYFSGGGYVIVWPILFLSYFLGGYVAGRLARSNSGRNGAATVLWSILLFFILALFGAFLPGPISRPLSVFAQGSVRPAIGSLVEAGLMGLGIVGALLLVLFLGGFLGGRLGNRRIADLVLRFYRARV